MRFDLLDYETTVGHLSLYYDAGGMFDVEINAAATSLETGALLQPFLVSLEADGRSAGTRHLPTYPSKGLVRDHLTRQFT